MLLLFLFLACIEFVSGQDWRLGVKAGLSVPRLRASKGDGFSSGYKSLMGPQTGIVAEYRFTNLFSLQTELNYSAQGGKKTGRQKINTAILAGLIPPGITLPGFLYANFNSKVALNYLELPLMARFSFQTNASSRISFYGGPYLGYLVTATGKSEGKSKIFTDAEQTTELTLLVAGNPIAVGTQDLAMERDIIPECNRFNYGFQGGMAYTYELNKWELFAAAGGTYGMKYLQKNSDFGRNKTGGAGVTIGATIKL